MTKSDWGEVERLAKKLCAQESKIWEEAGLRNRLLWRREAYAIHKAVEDVK